jgi:hypothetical protein
MGRGKRDAREQSSRRYNSVAVSFGDVYLSTLSLSGVGYDTVMFQSFKVMAGKLTYLIRTYDALLLVRQIKDVTVRFLVPRRNFLRKQFRKESSTSCSFSSTHSARRNFSSISTRTFL